jgi:hypothetical protein
MKSRFKTLPWIASVTVGILANIVLHQYRLHLYDRNADYPEFHPLQRVQYVLYYATITLAIVGAAWFVWDKIRQKR